MRGHLLAFAIVVFLGAVMIDYNTQGMSIVCVVYHICYWGGWMSVVASQKRARVTVRPRRKATALRSPS